MPLLYRFHVECFASIKVSKVYIKVALGRRANLRQLAIVAGTSRLLGRFKPLVIPNSIVVGHSNLKNGSAPSIIITPTIPPSVFRSSPLNLNLTFQVSRPTILTYQRSTWKGLRVRRTNKKENSVPVALTSKMRKVALEMLRGSSKPDKTEVLTQPTPTPGMPAFIYKDFTMLPHLDKEDEKIIAKWEQEYPCRYGGYSGVHLMFMCIPEMYRHKLNPRRMFGKKKHPFWAAKLNIHKVESVARLMRQGFDWTAANIVEGQDKFTLDCPYLRNLDHRCEKCRHMRTYKVRSLPGQAKWEGTLDIYTESRDAILDFDVSEVTADTCISAKALSFGRDIYVASRRSGMKYNGVFKDKPLGGWWLASGKGRSDSRYGIRAEVGSKGDSSSTEMLTFTTITALTAANMVTI